MALLRQIAQLGHAVLREPATPVSLPAKEHLRAFVADLMATMLDADGVGIAAPQVYESMSLFIVASRPSPRYPDAPLMDPLVVVNPEITWRSDQVESGWEGCLSIPGIRGYVPRPQKIRATFQDLDGMTIEQEFDGFVARVFQHEDDHLRGVVFLDRVASNRDLITEKEFRKLGSIR